MGTCIFCLIAKGEIPAKTVYEDEHVLAFLDIAPLAPGHTLVIPKRHVERVADLTPDEASRYFAQVPRIVAAVEKAVSAQGATLAWNDGKAAGQEVPHTHLHIVPRSSADGYGPIHAMFRGAQKAPAPDLDELREAVRRALSAR